MCWFRIVACGSLWFDDLCYRCAPVVCVAASWADCRIVLGLHLVSVVFCCLIAVTGAFSFGILWPSWWLLRRFASTGCILVLLVVLGFLAVGCVVLVSCDLVWLACFSSVARFCMAVCGGLTCCVLPIGCGGFLVGCTYWCAFGFLRVLLVCLVWVWVFGVVSLVGLVWGLVLA